MIGWRLVINAIYPEYLWDPAVDRKWHIGLPWFTKLHPNKNLGKACGDVWSYTPAANALRRFHVGPTGGFWWSIEWIQRRKTLNMYIYIFCTQSYNLQLTSPLLELAQRMEKKLTLIYNIYLMARSETPCFNFSPPSWFSTAHVKCGKCWALGNEHFGKVWCPHEFSFLNILLQPEHWSTNTWINNQLC